jgi:hypothetical protein
MATAVTYPDDYVEECPSGVRAIAAMPTSSELSKACGGRARCVPRDSVISTRFTTPAMAARST